MKCHQDTVVLEVLEALEEAPEASEAQEAMVEAKEASEDRGAMVEAMVEAQEVLEAQEDTMGVHIKGMEATLDIMGVLEERTATREAQGTTIQEDGPHQLAGPATALWLVVPALRALTPTPGVA